MKMQKIKHFFENEAVLVIAGLFAIASCFFVPVSAKYFRYIDFHVLAILFCLMAVVAGFIDQNMFGVLSEKLFMRIKNARLCYISLTLLCFFSAMLVTNDVALLTFVPLSILLLGNQNKMHLILVIVMQTVAANLGSMLTPVGNPQNLYLYSFYKFRFSTFFITVFPFAILGLVLCVVPFLFIKRKQLNLAVATDQKIKSKKIVVYIALFAVCILAVLRVISTLACFAVCVAVILLCDRSLLKKVDYSLLLTFVAFFVFVGNLSSIPQVTAFITSVITNQEMLCGVALSQIISNVPAAVMLSGFTQNAKALLIGANIGGLGTIVASLASLISYKLYAKSKHSNKGKYMVVFTIINAVILAIMLGLAFFII